MPAATNKSDLIAVSELEWAKLQKAIDRIPEELALVKDDDDTSIKDILGHRAHWIDLFLGWYRNGVAGKDVYLPAKGYKWNELNRYNRDLRVRQADLTWDDAQKQLTKAHKALLAFVSEASDSDLYGGPMPGGNNKWTTGRFAEASGPSHYRSAAKYLRQRLRQYQA